MVRGADRRLTEIEALYRERFPYFVQVAQAVVGDRERAVEAVQDAFVSVIRNRDSFRGDGALEAWVWRAVVNAARKATRRPLVEVGEERDAEYGAPEAVANLAPLVASLPERQRLTTYLRYYLDMDYRTIAAVLEVEVGTVSATLASAHATLRKKLRKVEADA